MATVGACAAFAAVSGSSLATAATMGTVALPEMKRHKYDPRLATGSIAAGGTIGILIPPSVALIVYGILTNESIGELFIAGIIPGIMQGLFYIFTIMILCRINPSLATPGRKASGRERIQSLRKTWMVLLLFLIVIGGIYFGVFSPTEAAGIGACGACAFAFLRGSFNWSIFKESLVGSTKNTAMIFLIFLGAMILGYFLTATRLSFDLAEYIGGLPVHRYAILGLIMAMYLLLGCLMDALPMIILTLPIFFPIVKVLGFDPIWFGIVVVRLTEIGLITPPVGLNVFVIKGMADDVPMFSLFKGIGPFLIADVCHVALLLALPQIVTFLPHLMK